MATITQPEPQARTDVPRIVPFEMTVELFERIVEAGLLPQDRPIFLWDGRLCEKMAKTVAHGWVGATLTKQIVKALPTGWTLWPESTIVLDDRSAPLPDFSIIRCENPADFANPPRYPGPKDVGILIEIAVTSLKTDLSDSLEAYARAGIPVYWVVDVAGKRVLVHSEPATIENRGRYGKVEIFGPGGQVPLMLDGFKAAEIPFDAIMK
jgi:Uma2 family endonuclease